jgi:hypothetical protein
MDEASSPELVIVQKIRGSLKLDWGPKQKTKREEQDRLKVAAMYWPNDGTRT